MSRSKDREKHLKKAANNGKMSARLRGLYISEVKGLQKKHGLTISEQEKKLVGNKKLYDVVVGWDNAYNNGIPSIVLDYTIGVIETYPENLVTSFAQELWIIAKRANRKK